MQRQASMRRMLGLPGRPSRLKGRRRLPAAARVAVRVAGVAALAAGGVVLGRGVVGVANTRPSLVELTGAGARRAEAHPSVLVDAAGRPVFSSAIRSWAAAAAGSEQVEEPSAASLTPVGSTDDAAAASLRPLGSTTDDAAVGAASADDAALDAAAADDAAVAAHTGPGAQVAAQPTAAPVRPPSPTAAPVQVPSTPLGAAPPAVASQGAATPDAAVRSFYAYLDDGLFDQAAGVWSQRMRSAYPPPEYINSRFSRTQSITLSQADVIALDNAKGRATVAIRLSEVIGPPISTRRYVGTWSVVRGPNGWVLDQPNLQLS